MICQAINFDTVFILSFLSASPKQTYLHNYFMYLLIYLIQQALISQIRQGFWYKFKLNIKISLTQYLYQKIVLLAAVSNIKAMELQSLLQDPNIATFLDQIPLNERIITLKQLIYIGIKIVNNQFSNQQPTPNQTLSQFANKQNADKITILSKPLQNSNKKGKSSKVLKQKSTPNLYNHTKNQKVESTLLREISKIRVQLENLTNKVYDHYFDEQNQQTQTEYQQIIPFNKKGRNYQVVSYGFENSGQNPIFSPQRNIKALKQKSHVNPFLKQKSGIQSETQVNNRLPIKQSFQKYQNSQSSNNVSRNRAKSNLRHLDDTQVRQALYRQDEIQSQSQKKGRAKKSQSVIERRHQQRKKDQKNFFYQLNVEKQRLDELKRFKENKNILTESLYRQYTQILPTRVDHIKKNVKSRIKKDVERDRLRYQSKIQEENFKKGFEQYQYSSNQQIEEDQYENNQAQNQAQDDFDEDDHNYEEKLKKQGFELQQGSQQPKLSASKKFMNSPQEEYDRQRDISQPNFGFYDSHKKSSSSAKEKVSYNSQSIKNDRVINAANDESSFSQFSQFSISSSNSRRENGKISRRRNE